MVQQQLDAHMSASSATTASSIDVFLYESQPGPHWAVTKLKQITCAVTHRQ